MHVTGWFLSIILTWPVSGPVDTEPGALPPILIGSGANLQFEDPLGLTTEESNSFSSIVTKELFDFNVGNAAPMAEMDDLLASQVSGTGRYSGSILARVGDGSEFLRGTVRLTASFTAEQMTGTISNLEFVGPDAAERAATPALNQLALRPTVFSGQELEGSIVGTFDEGGFLTLSDPEDQHQVEATFTARFVDLAQRDGGTELVGVLEGTITSKADGSRQIMGILEGDSGF